MSYPGVGNIGNLKKPTGTGKTKMSFPEAAYIGNLKNTHRYR